MNIDAVASFSFGDVRGLQDFMLVHRLVHDATAGAVALQFGETVSTFGIGDSSAEDAWAMLMHAGESGRVVLRELQNWLELHARVHEQVYNLLGGDSASAPDLSDVDFSSPEQFHDWMYAHQTVHDFEQRALGIT